MSSPERLLFVDGSSGASGDMILGALVDLGVPFARLRRGLAALPLDGYTLRSRRVERCGLAARKIDVRVRGHEHGRGLAAIRRILRQADGLSPTVRRRAAAIFQRLIEAEARAHGRPPGKVHLHEAGGTDAIVDVVGASIALEYLAPTRIRVAPLTTGFGTVRCAHGDYPVPGPATLELVRGLPIRAGRLAVERLTPTGAAILAEVADEWGPFPLFRPRAVGYGAGDRELEGHPNCLRMILGEPEPSAVSPATATVLVIECQLDDATPETLAHASERLLETGALDVFTSAITMKKGRAGHRLTVLARPEHLAELTECVLRETPSFGLRIREEQRIELERSHVRVRTPYGRVRVKLALRDGEVWQASPEHDDCAAAARRHGVSLTRVRRAAVAAWAAREP